MNFLKILQLLFVSIFFMLFATNCAKTQFFGGKGPKKSNPISENLDSDKDGIPDIIEKPKGDTDKDGIPNYLDPDDDNDGVATLYEGTESQANRPGSANSVSLVPAGTDGSILVPDTDHDGIPDYLDPDDDNDSIPSSGEDINHNDNLQDDDTDHDGIPNYLDPDDDGDGILTIDEDVNNNGDLNDDDTDHDGIPNYLDPDDNTPNQNSPASQCTGGTKDQNPVFCRCLAYDANKYPIFVNAYNIASYQGAIIADFNQHAGTAPNHDYEKLVFMKENFVDGKILSSNLLFNTFCMENFNVQDRPFTDGFPFVQASGSSTSLNIIEWFALDSYAKIIIPQTDTWEFQIISDDGAQLYIDNELIIDNDGMHDALTKSKSKFLTAGEHNLRMKYFQGPKVRIALQLFWRRQSVSGPFLIIPRESFKFSGKI